MKASSTAPSSNSGDAAELDRLDAQIVADTPPEPETPPPADAPPQPAPDPADTAAAVLDHIGEHPEALEKMTEADVRDLLELVFGFVATSRGKHWEMPDDGDEARRIGKYIMRSLDRHGWATAGKWLPDLLAVALLVNAIAKRARQDKATRAEIATPPAAGPRAVP